MRLMLIHNPGAGGGGDDDVASACQRAGHSVSEVTPQDWTGELIGDAELVVAAGGDGTVRTVFRELAGRDVPVTVLAGGTANNIARALGMPPEDDVERLARGWADAPRRRFAVPEATIDGRRQRFVESLGAGLFAAVIARAQDQGREPGGEDKLRQGLRLLRDLAPVQPTQRWRTKPDASIPDEVVALELMNVGSTGPRVPLAPGLVPGSGSLAAVAVLPAHRDELRDYADQRLAGMRPQPPAVPAVHVRHLHLWGPDGALLRLDDDLCRPRGYPVDVTVGDLWVQIVG